MTRNFESSSTVKRILRETIEKLLSSREPEIYEGKENVFEAFKAYEKEADKAGDYMEWQKGNAFLSLISRTSNEIYGIRYYGEHPDLNRLFLFRTDLVPFRILSENANGVLKDARSVLDQLNGEIEQMKREAEYPLFLIADARDNNYDAWSLNEDKEIFVVDYKSYRNRFGIKDGNHISSSEKYRIIPPSLDLILNMGLLLFPSHWKYQNTGDRWELRPLRKEIDGVPEEHRKIYEKAIEIVNLNRYADMGMPDEFQHLEYRLDTFERLVDLEAPDFVLENSAESLMKVMKSMKHHLDMQKVTGLLS